MLIKSNSPRSTTHPHAAEFDTLCFNQRIPREMTFRSTALSKKDSTSKSTVYFLPK